MLYEQLAYRDNLTEELGTTAGIIGDNVASSLSFDDPSSAEMALQSLSHDQDIAGAAIYDKDGKLFAKY